MPYISRQVGTVSSLVTLFLNDRTVSTGAGLANIVASTVRISWLRSDQAAVSSWTLTTGTLGTWTASTMTQVGSTSTLGAYQFSLPDGAFVSGDSVYVHIMSSTSAFAEVPLVIELTKTDNQTYLSSQVIGRVNAPVGVSTLPAVSSISTPVTASSVTAGVNVTTITAGLLSTQAVSSVVNPHGFLARGTVSTGNLSSVILPLAYSQGAIDGAQIFITESTAVGNTRFITSWDSGTSTAFVSPPFSVAPSNGNSKFELLACGRPRTSSGTLPQVTVASTMILSGTSTLTAAALSSFFTLDAGDYSTSVLGSIVQEIADNVSATVGAQVGVSSISIPVGVSTITAGVLSTHSISSVINEGGLIHRGTAVSSTASTIQLDATLSSQFATDILTGAVVFIKGGAGAGQSRVLDDWTSTGSVAAISPNWTVNPTSTSVYELHASPPSSNSTFPLVTLASTQIALTVSSFTDDAHIGLLSRGTLDGATASTATMPITYADSNPQGAVLYIKSGTGSGQSRYVADWDTETSTAHITPNWQITPTSSSIFELLSHMKWPTSSNAIPQTVLASSMILIGTSTVTTPVTASSVTAGVNVTSFVGSAAVTSAAGVLGPVSVSSVSTPVSASSVTAPVAVSTITVAAMSSFFTLDAGDYSTSVLGSVVQEIADNVSATVGAQVGVSSISIPVSVSSLVTSNPVTVSNITVNALTRLFDTGVVFFSTAVVSSVVFEVATNVKPPAPVGVSTLPAISSITTPVTASSVTRAVDVSSFHGTLAVTSAAGVLGPVRVSSISIPVSVSSGVVAVSTITVAAMSSFFTLDAGDYSTSVLGSVVQEIADNVSATVGAQVGVSSISIPVSVSAVTVPVSTATPVTVSNMTVGALTRFFDTGAVFFSTAVVSSVAFEIATNVKPPAGVGVSSIATPVTASSVSAPVGVSTLPAVSSITTPVTASSVTAAVNVSSIYGSAAVTSAAGVWGPLAVSSVSTPVTASSVTAGVNVTSLIGSPWVTSAAGVPGPLRVSSISTPVSASSVTVPVGVSTLTVAAVSSLFTLDAGDYSTAALGSVVKEIADNVSATVGAQVGVSSISIPVAVSSVSVVVSSNIVKVNNVTVTGTGAAGDEWGP